MEMGSMEKKDVRRYREDGFTIIDLCCASLPAELFLSEIRNAMQNAQAGNDWRKKEVIVAMLGETYKNLGYEYMPADPEGFKRELEGLNQNDQQFKMRQFEQNEASKKMKLDQLNISIQAILNELPNLSDENLYRSAACTTISVFSIRFKTDKEFLKKALEYVTTCLSEKSIEDFAANALFRIC